MRGFRDLLKSVQQGVLPDSRLWYDTVRAVTIVNEELTE
jgi:hypothetical protein